MKTLTETFNSISVKKGEFFLVELAANHSTGYSWEMEVAAGDAKLVSTVYIPDDSKGNTCGGGGTARWLYMAQEDGLIEINAEYKRPWEKKPPAKAVRFQARVG